MGEFSGLLELAKDGSPILVAFGFFGMLLGALRKKWLVLGWVHVEQIDQINQAHAKEVGTWNERHSEQKNQCDYWRERHDLQLEKRIQAEQRAAEAVRLAFSAAQTAEAGP